MKKINFNFSALIFLLGLGSVVSSCSDLGGASDSIAAPGPNGQGGSLARFAIAGEHLYTVSETTLSTYSVSLAKNPSFQKSVELGVGIETIFPYQNMLFIGSRTGMHIYDRTDPTNPVFLSRYDHVMSCDPVVVQGDYAYVTLRDGTDCRFGTNLLDVVNISNPQSPFVQMTIPMIHPHGLGVDGNTLFVCEGSYGLKVFDITDPANPKESAFMEDIQTYDVIPRNRVLIVTGADGIFQYRYDESGNLTLLSQLQ